MGDVFAIQAQRASFINQAVTGQDYGLGHSTNEKYALHLKSDT
jgi:hypothetical protein